MGGTYIDSTGRLRNLDGSAVTATQAGYSPFNGDFYDSGGNIRNIDSLGGGGGGGVGPPGKDGKDGEPGKDGANAYVHIRWGTSATPATLLTTPAPFIGIYSGNSATAPTGYEAYTWYEYKGDKGDKGEPGPDGYTPQLRPCADLGDLLATSAMYPLDICFVEET